MLKIKYNPQNVSLKNFTQKKTKYSNLPLKFATWIYAALANLTGRCELNNLCSNRELLKELFCKHHVCQWITSQVDVFCPEVKKKEQDVQLTSSFTAGQCSRPFSRFWKR